MLDAVLEFITQSETGWGVAFLLAGWVFWSVVTDRLVTPGRHKERVEELQERLAAEQEDKEFWRNAATLSTEMGDLLAKAKVERRRGSPDDNEG